jgi:hypothetical protein
MPRAAKTKPHADRIYVARQTFASDAQPDVIRRGERRPGDDPVVQRHSWAWVPAGVPEHEWPRVERPGEQRPAAPPPPGADVALPARPEGFTGRDVVELKRDVRVAVGPDHEGAPPEVVEVRAGTMFFEGAPLPAALPSAFVDGSRGLRRK